MVRKPRFAEDDERLLGRLDDDQTRQQSPPPRHGSPDAGASRSGANR
jgi:hypothetical protein